MPMKKICAVGDIPPNSMKKINVGHFHVMVANTGKEFRVFPPVCPHMEEPLEESGVIDAQCVLTCTKHLWQWDLNSMTPTGAAEKPIETYACKVEGGHVLADVDVEIVYDFEEDDDTDDDDFFKKS